MGKFAVNSKAQAGRERKAAQKELKKKEEESKKEELEAREWAVGAKAKSHKQELDEQKRLEKVKQKDEKKKLEAQEQAELSKYRPIKPLPKEKNLKIQPTVITKNQIEDSNLKERTQGGDDLSPKNPVRPASKRDTVTDNEVVYSASNIDDALFLLDTATGSSTSLNKVGGIERHPERRARAAYAAFEERELPNLRKEFPQLRMSQLKEKLQKMWQKSLDNPFNQSHIAYNATKCQEILHNTKEVESNLERLRFTPSNE